ncbi:unnamed protein product [Ectocarpus sp. CCAP 1310/34]|nr:unnamed protein product [Ectocarpus sp. CCAP 1310/34]
MAFQPLGEDRPLPPTLDADLCCMEDGWDKDSPSNTGSAAAAAAPGGAAAAATCMLPREQHQLHQRQPGAAAAAAGVARLPTPSERAQRRRSRPGPAIPSPSSSSSSPSAAGRLFIVSEPGPPIEERKDGLLKMIQAQHKFLPAGVNGRAGARARCHVVSPFVGKRRGQFVAWENQMATFLGYNRDTVAVALNYFDRYTCEKRCSPTLAQAVAATALHTAAKFEETKPASLVLNWDLRPVTVYDFVRAFCALLVQGEGSSHAAAASTSGVGGASVSVSLQAREEKKEELERLGVWAEDIADLASFDVRFVNFLPSTLATAALLLSASRGGGGGAAATAAASVPPTSHAEVLDVCWKGPAEADAASDGAAIDGCGGTGVASLRRVLECVLLLGSSLAERYPAVASAARSAAEGVARYAGFPVPSGTSNVPPRREPAGRKRAAQAATPPVVAVKGRRCATPTGVEGIVHIEMDTLRGGEAGLQQQQHQPSEHKPRGSGDGALAGGGGGGGGSSAPVGGEGLGPGGSVHVKQEHQLPQGRHRRPTPIITAAAGAANNSAAGQPQHQDHTPACAEMRGSSSSFAYSGDDVAFSRATKHTRAAATATATAAAMAAVTSASTAASPRATAVDAGSDMNGAVAAGSSLMSCNIRKRSAEALGHCESGSGFGAPATRRRLEASGVAGKAMKRVSVSAASSAALPPAASSAGIIAAVAATGVNDKATGSRN